MYPDRDEMLPGFELPTANDGRLGPNVTAVGNVVARLNAAGVLTADHDDYVQAALTLAGFVDRLPANAKPYAVAQLLAQHIEALKALHPAPGETEAPAGSSGTLVAAIDRLFAFDDDLAEPSDDGPAA